MTGAEALLDWIVLIGNGFSMGTGMKSGFKGIFLNVL